MPVLRIFSQPEDRSYPRDSFFPVREKIRHTVCEYIEVDYNRARRHSANGQISPMAFEALQAA